MVPLDTVGTTAEARNATAQPFDWRRPSKFGREHVRALTNVHDVFCRRMSTSFGSLLRALVQVESFGIEQMTYDDYTRSLPTPNISALFTLPPLPAGVVMEMNVGFALQMVDRLLGGRGLPVELRRPTDLELPLIHDLCSVAVLCLADAIEPMLGAKPELSSLETNPQMVQATSPSDMVLLLSFRLTIAQGEPTESLLTLCYPAATLTPVLDRLVVTAGASSESAVGQESLADIRHRIAAHLDDVTVPLSVQLTDSSVRAGDLLALGVGDVLRLDHRVGEPVLAKVGQTPVLRGHLGRRGRRMGLQVLEPIPPAADAFADDGSIGASRTNHAYTGAANVD